MLVINERLLRVIGACPKQDPRKVLLCVHVKSGDMPAEDERLQVRVEATDGKVMAIVKADACIESNGDSANKDFLVSGELLRRALIAAKKDGKIGFEIVDATGAPLDTEDSCTLRQGHLKVTAFTKNNATSIFQELLQDGTYPDLDNCVGYGNEPATDEFIMDAALLKMLAETACKMGMQGKGQGLRWVSSANSPNMLYGESWEDNAKVVFVIMPIKANEQIVKRPTREDMQA